MVPVSDPQLPFGVAWLSLRLHREVGPGPEDHLTIADELSGTRIEVDGWDEALGEAWRRLASEPAIDDWLEAYLRERGEEGLEVTFSDTPRVVARHAFGRWNVHYPADLLLGSVDAVAAMRAALVTVLDRHVERQALDVPLLGELLAD
ncbi:hypothetical protein [Nocardioides zeicaulis]|uniref:Uncharacterized protein n=1 Tax=Nocardioides zeicaulis TaxID=1776857 RepID=A0ABV6DZZ6_9ACTN